MRCNCLLAPLWSACQLLMQFGIGANAAWFKCRCWRGTLSRRAAMGQCVQITAGHARPGPQLHCRISSAGPEKVGNK